MTEIEPGMPSAVRRVPFERVDRDVDLGTEACADPLVVEEHRRLVLLPLADHDDALHRDGVDHAPHEIDGRAVGGVLVAATDPAGRSHRCRLRHADELEREVPIGDGGIVGGAHASVDPTPATASLTWLSVGSSTTTATPAQMTRTPPTSA